jgi:hypothetical protein
MWDSFLYACLRGLMRVGDGLVFVRGMWSGR